MPAASHSQPQYGGSKKHAMQTTMCLPLAFQQEYWRPIVFVVFAGIVYSFQSQHSCAIRGDVNSLNLKCKVKLDLEWVKQHPLLDERETTRNCPCKYDNDGLTTGENPGSRGDAEEVARILGGLFIRSQRGGGNLEGLRRKDVSHMERCMVCETREDPRFFPRTLGLLEGKQMLIDDYLIEAAENVDRSQEYPIELDGPVIEPSEPWEDRVGFPGSVSHNGTHFMMHYRLVSGRLAGAKGVHHEFNKTLADLLVAAVSEDGVRWEKHRARMVDPDGKRHNGVVNYPSTDTCVLRDEHERRPRYRYKMTYNCFQNGWQRYEIDNDHEPSYRRRRTIDHTCLATSPDGLRWEDHGRIFGGATDTQPCLYHDSPGNYTYILRKDFHTAQATREIRGTQLYTISYDEFHRNLNEDGPLPFHLVTRFYLDRNTKLERFQHQIYAVTGSVVEGVHVGVFSILDWPRLPKERKTWRKATTKPFPKDIVQPYMATSRDGFRYNMAWIYKKEPLRLGKGKNYKYVATAAQIITHGGYHWVYYTGNVRYHHERWRGTENIRLARYPQDRLSALIPIDRLEPASVVIKPFIWPKQTASLRVNVGLLEEKSSLFVALRDLSHRNSTFSILIGRAQGTRAEHEVCFDIEEGKLDSISAAQLRLDFQCARLYSFTFSKHSCSS
mmetsp:Transcript_30546/g.74394  ORF Transcript_30546/g.74394 Transcript_30546/m.74394 type:complete len:669 (+) Transcript_30546:132-2138(+)